MLLKKRCSAIALAVLLAGGVWVYISALGQSNTSERDHKADDLLNDGPRDSGESVEEAHSTQRKSLVILVFPDTDPIQITWRPRPSADISLDPNDYESLKAYAQAGNSYAAYLLSQLLANCMRAFATSEEMESAIDRLQQTHRIVYPDSDQEVRIADPEQTIPIAVQRIRQQFEKCAKVPASERTMSDSWLQLASDSGFLPAIMDQAYGEKCNEAAIRLFEQAWHFGDAEALLAMSQRYYNNWKSGIEPTDKVRAYATLYLYTRVTEAGMGPGTGHGETAARELASIQQTLDTATADMYDHELQQAIDIAAAMIRSNPSCCFQM